MAEPEDEETGYRGKLQRERGPQGSCEERPQLRPTRPCPGHLALRFPRLAGFCLSLPTPPLSAPEPLRVRGLGGSTGPLPCFWP